MSKNINNHINTKKYIIGFFISIILTIMSFGFVILYGEKNWWIGVPVICLIVLAIIQIIVHILCFLHLNTSIDAKWNFLSIFTSLICVFIIISGTWLTMQHLNMNMMGDTIR